ncbi:indolepyruvate ferredoxin oxidoreductase [Dysgonomonas sp. 216]|uniref:thiamine pyrophosphate-dependent enzyme n=1 Tax=Dysgonomonas sp. 216 TaxID=2302934 RepID=UPI0013D88C71|nr:thiamine pyrophosphate-dependent enzyme [Dysgonomonas sp. 216]NDW19838.1 indolepyruvate ferredoxin oxidoreductase [Dysgonomonas sp. 216]
MTEKLLLLGDQAIALGAIHAGITGVYAYPGTPSTEITEYIQESPLAADRKIHSQWCTNEKTAMEAALGVSYIGKRSLVCMKHVGLNVAADAFVNSSMTGVHGGLVVLVADDPSMHSSQNEQDSRYYGKFAFTPVFEPSSQQEAYDMIRFAFDFSEKYALPVLMRITTRMAHSRAVVQTLEVRKQNEISFSEDKSRWVLLPVNARRRYNELLAVQPELEKQAAESSFNEYKKGSKQGVIACGIAYNYLMENFPNGCDYTVLKISQYPLPVDIIKEMVSECDEVLVLEEGQPFVEEQVRGILDCTGKIKGRLSGELPRVGELTPDSVRAALGFGGYELMDASKNVVGRPPALCTGCGHRDVYDALNEVIKDYKDAKVFSDIGCYTLGALPPFRAIDTCVDMGASITMAKGAADGGLFPSIAVIGDSTFTHSGITGLLDAVNSKANVLIIISDNLTTAMTGGQDSAGTEKLEAICLGVGVEPEHLHVVIPLPKNMDEIKRVFKQELEYNGVSVIIPRRECIQTLKRNAKKNKK